MMVRTCRSVLRKDHSATARLSQLDVASIVPSRISPGNPR